MVPPPLLSQKTRFTDLLRYWAPVGIYAGLIYFLSSQSTPSHYIPRFLFGMGDKVLHALEYGILAVLLYRAIKYTVSNKWAMGLAIFTAMAYGASDEIHQWFVPQRQMDFWDLVADTFGATVLVLAWVFFTERRTSTEIAQNTGEISLKKD